jgi:hypothetical protein
MSENKYAPFVLNSFEGAHEVLLFDFEEYSELFEEHGFSGNGHSWGSLVSFILKKEDTALYETVTLDPEGDTFVAIASTEQDQQKLAALLSSIANDKAKLGSYLGAVDPDDMDD